MFRSSPRCVPAPVGQRATALLAPALLLTALVATGCGSGDEVATSATEDQLSATTEAQDSASAEATATSTEDGTERTAPSEPSATAEPTGGATAEEGAGSGASTDSPAATAPATAAEPAVLTAAQSGVAALNGTSWDAMYDISCQALLGGQSRADYVAAFSAAGTPADRSGGPLAVGKPVDGAEVDDADLVAVSGPVAWVEIVQAGSPGEVTGVARLVQESGRWTFCGLAQ